MKRHVTLFLFVCSFVASGLLGYTQPADVHRPMTPAAAGSPSEGPMPDQAQDALDGKERAEAVTTWDALELVDLNSQDSTSAACGVGCCGGAFCNKPVSCCANQFCQLSGYGWYTCARVR
jgi:hypothetical protein